MVLPAAKSVPSVPSVSTNMDGSISGEDSQNAITAGSGTPMLSRAAIRGITPQEQKGERPPMSADATIIMTTWPLKARAIRLSAPVAVA